MAEFCKEADLLIEQYTKKEIIFYILVEWFESHWDSLNDDSRTHFRNCVLDEGKLNEEIHSISNVFTNHNTSDAFLSELYSIIELYLKQEIHKSSILPFIDGGLIFCAVSDGEEEINPSFQIPSFSRDSSEVTNIQTWISLRNPNRPKDYENASEQYVTLFTFVNATNLVHIRMYFPKTKGADYSIRFVATSHMDNTERQTISEMPMKLPEYPYKSDDCLMTSYLLTLALTSPSIITLHVDAQLSSEIDLPLQSMVGDTAVYVGDSKAHEIAGTIQDRKEWDLNELIESGRDFAIVSSTVILSGPLCPEYISTLCLLGPLFYQTSTVPPQLSVASSLFFQDKPLLYLGVKDVIVRDRLDYTVQDDENNWYCYVDEKRCMDLVNLTMSADSYCKPLQCIKVHNCGYCIFKGTHDIEFFISLDVQLKFITDMYDILSGFFFDKKNDITVTLFEQILDCMSLMIYMDPTLLISLYKNEVVMLIFACLYYIPTEMYRNTIVDHILLLLQVLMCTDHTCNNLILGQYMKLVMFNPLLFKKMSYEASIYAHEQLISLFKENVYTPIITNNVSIKEYCDCIIQGGISHLDSVSYMLRLFLDNDSPSIPVNQMYSIVYDMFIQMAFHEYPLVMTSPIRRVLSDHFFNLRVSEKRLSQEFQDNNVVQVAYHFLAHIVESPSISSMKYANLQLSDVQQSHDNKCVESVDTVFWSSFCLLTHINNSKKTKDSIVFYRQYFYDTIYMALESLGTENWRENDIICNGMKRLSDLYRLWLKGNDLRDWSGPTEARNTDGKPFCHYKLLAHYLLTMRYVYDITSIRAFLVDFVQCLSCVENPIVSDISSSNQQWSMAHRFILFQSVLKEFILLHKCSSQYDDAQSHIEQILGVLLYGDFEYVTFASNLSYSVVNILLAYSEVDASTIIGSVLKVIFINILSRPFLPNAIRLSNLRSLLAVVEEVGVTSIMFLASYRTHFIRMMKRERILSPRSASQDAESLSESLSILESDTTTQTEGESETTTSDDSQLLAMSQALSTGEKTESAESIYSERKEELFIEELVESVDVINCLTPLVDMLYALDKTLITDTTVCDVFCAVLFRKMYYETSQYNATDKPIQTRIDMLRRLMDCIHCLLSICVDNTTQYSNLIYSYIITVKECYGLINGYVDNGKLIIGLFQNECVTLVDTISSNSTLPPLLRVPSIHLLPVEILTMSLLSQIGQPVFLHLLQFMFCILQSRPVIIYSQTNMKKGCFDHATTNADVKGMKDYPSFITYTQEIEKQNNMSRERYNNSWVGKEENTVRMMRSRLTGWRYLSICNKEKEMFSSESYLLKCTYYVTDPHMSYDGVRRKMMRIPPPSITYDQASDNRSHCSDETDRRGDGDSVNSQSTHSSVHSSMQNSSQSGLINDMSEKESKSMRSLIPMLKRLSKKNNAVNVQGRDYELRKSDRGDNDEWIAMNVSTYDIQWGVVVLQSFVLYFYIQRKPESIADFSLLPLKRSILPMRRIQVIDLQQAFLLVKRVYNCQQSALELFFRTNGHVDSIYLYFADVKTRNNAYSKIVRKLATTAKFQKLNETSQEFACRIDVETEWSQGLLTNFEYLMRLNTISGRSLQDVTQYPVFPWVLKEYNTTKFDVNDSRFYRDLSLPMGAQTSDRLLHYIDRFEMLSEESEPSSRVAKKRKQTGLDINDDQIPPYFYGSHYSTALGCVLYYLVRKEPFTQLHVCLQNGHFDVTDRLFHSIPVTLQTCMTNLPEVKELVPEWYYDVNFLENQNKFVFGEMQVRYDMKTDLQDGETVGDVTVSPITSRPTSRVDVISHNLQALENPLSTSELGDWVDLIFGYKQTGDEAIKNYNLFYYLTYPENVDISGIDDHNMRSAVVTQAAHFGQCPQILFKTAHSKKRMDTSLPRNLRCMLLQSDPSSIYTQSPNRWLGTRCRILAVSDFDNQALMSCITNIQSVMGYSNLDRSPPSPPVIEKTDNKIGCVLPVIKCVTPSISWPTTSLYPWIVTVDNNEFFDMMMVKIVSDGNDSMAYNIKSHCFRLEISSDTITWSDVPLLAETSVKKGNDIISFLSFNNVTTRYWRIIILDIPFSNRFAATCLLSEAIYSAGDKRNERDSFAKKTVIRCAGLNIQKLDVMGRPLFPHVPSPAVNIYNKENILIHGGSVWGEHLATIVNDFELHMICLRHKQHYAIYDLKILRENQYRVVFIHPMYPLLFVDDHSNGGILIIVLNNTINSSPSFEPVNSFLRVQIFAACPIISITAENNIVVFHSKAGIISTFILKCSPNEKSVKVLFQSLPTALISTPFSSSYKSSILHLGMDCILLFNKKSQMTERMAADDTSKRILIYTSILELRGIVTISGIIDCYISRYGIFVLYCVETKCSLKKFDFCGELISCLNFDSYIKCGCINGTSEIMAFGSSDGDILFVDALLNRILTRIPSDKCAKQILFNIFSTGVIEITDDNSVMFYQLNNCINIVSQDKMLDGKNTTASNMKAKIMSLFN